MWKGELKATLLIFTGPIIIGLVLVFLFVRCGPPPPP